MGKGKIKGGRGDRGEERIKGEGIKLNLNSSRLLSLSLSLYGAGKVLLGERGSQANLAKLKLFLFINFNLSILFSLCSARSIVGAGSGNPINKARNRIINAKK